MTHITHFNRRVTELTQSFAEFFRSTFGAEEAKEFALIED